MEIILTKRIVYLYSDTLMRKDKDMNSRREPIRSRSNRGRKNMPVSPDVNNIARELRISRRWTLDGVSKRIGVIPSTLSQYERTGKGIGEDKIRKLARLYGVKIRELESKCMEDSNCNCEHR